MKLYFLGATHEVTGSCTLLEACGKKILIDCGLEQGADTYENCDIPVLPGEIDAVCLTHAHMDHSGKIPALVAKGFKGPVFATEATHKLSTIMLRDSAHIQEFEAQWRNRKAARAGEAPYVPLYTMADAEKTLQQFSSHPYEQEVKLFEGITLTFRDAGHLLGSASIYLTVTEEGQTRTILFSGDLGNYNRPLIRDPQPAKPADFVVVESTYGDRLHGPRPDYLGQLSSILQDTFDRGGNVVIPSFAIGRTQELLYLLRTIKEQGLVKGHDGFPVYVDSPLAVEATRIYACGMTDYYDSETLELLEKGIDPVLFPDLRLSITSDESKLINADKEPKVILSASGMCEAGRIRHHLKHNLWRSDSTILFVGYQSGGTIGRKLVDGTDSVRLFGETISVHAAICELDGISGHADRDMLLNWLRSMGKTPTQVFVNHGDDVVCDSFVTTVQQQLSYPASAPFSGDGYDLINCEWFQKAAPVRAVGESKGRRNAVKLYERLLETGKRMMRLIESMKNASNKEISRLTDQLNALLDKYK
ncbi:MAG: MBL fold metallo-hydrolase [Oscillospiraceae bacterium]|nr:MBL fold metallo-hydrolase [Oscillospiraceae bacterium]